MVSTTLLAVLLFLAACGEKAAIPASSLPSLVLQPEDVPRGFTQFDAGEQTMSDVIPGPRADRERFGRQGGWKARFRRPGGIATRGPLVIESRADVFDGGGGAKRDLEAYREQFELQVAESGDAGRMLEPPKLGAGAIAMELRQPGTPGVQLYAIAFRRENATASVTVTGILGKLTFDQARRLARAQALRVDAARQSL